MHDQQILPEATNLNTHLLSGVVHKEEGDLRTGLGFRIYTGYCVCT